MVSVPIEPNPHSLSGTWGPWPSLHQHLASLSSAMSDFMPVLFHAMMMSLPWIPHALQSSVPSMMPFLPSPPAKVLLANNQLKCYWDVEAKDLGRLHYSLSWAPTEIYLYFSLGNLIILKSAIKASQWMTTIPTRWWTVYSPLNFPKFKGDFHLLNPRQICCRKRWSMSGVCWVWLEQWVHKRKFRDMKLEK